jgi:hypothetical protein
MPWPRSWVARSRISPLRSRFSLGVIDQQELARFSLPASNLTMVPRPATEDPDVRTSRGALLRLRDRARTADVKSGEAEEVAALIARKLANNIRGDHLAMDTLEVRGAFLRRRFTGPLTAFEKADRFYSRLDTTLNLVSIASGIGASLLAASKSPSGWTIILGVVIAGCQTLSQWLKPSQRAARRGRAAFELRSEAWDIVQGRDRYRGKDIDRAWDIFCDQIDKVEGREQTVEASESSCDGPGAPPETRVATGGVPDGP